jgi:hypothetical protein
VYPEERSNDDRDITFPHAADPESGDGSVVHDGDHGDAESSENKLAQNKKGEIFLSLAVDN